MNTRGDRRLDRVVVAVLAAIAYLPALLSSPGRMPADTKLYLYLDPGRLITSAPKAWDTSQFGGWVPHQMLSYLWPSGPWFWLCEQLGLPQWVSHRLWIGTILFLGGWGVYRLARTLGLIALGAMVAAFVYQLSPYILPYVSRTSLMLLPWASLGWLTLLTIHSVRRGGWRYPALLALVVFTVAGVNATAFATILPGPILWVLTDWHARRVTRQQVLGASARIAALSVSVSIWWVAMLSIQGKYGADVLAYSETLEAVSLTSTSTEVMRSLGYWLFYIRDPYAAATTAATPYLASGRLIVIGFLLLLVCAAGFVLVRWTYRRFAVLLVLAGFVLSVGVHPFSNPAPALSLIRDTGLGLSLRSSTRALPLLSLGLGLGAASLVVAIGGRRPRFGRAAAAVVVLLTAVNLPSLWRAQLVDPALERDQRPPPSWYQAADALDETAPQNRVLQLPGAEFGAYRWGYTVDQPIPGITDKPLITRDLLPLGSVQVMDLLYALDNRVQNGSLDPNSIAPVARLLAADRVWLSNDLAFDRFRTPRPEIFADIFHRPVSGLSDPIAYGIPAVNTPDISMVDEQSISDPRVGTPLAPVELVAVDDPTAMVRLGSRVVVLDGSGDGVVDAAAAGLLAGDEAVRYANDMSADEWASLPTGTVFVVTDSNRDRNQQWRGSQDTLGMTESGGPSSDGVVTDASDQRLPVFTTSDPALQTVARLDGGLVAQATSYGEPFAYLPEARAAKAVDGDPNTAWRIGQRWNPIGESITLTGADTRELHVLQAQGRMLQLMITTVDIDVDGQVQHETLGPESLSGGGQAIAIPQGSSIKITITGFGPRPGAPATGELWVGFAELGPVAQEWVQPPTTVLDFAPASAPTALVFHREWVRPTDRWRSDPETVLARSVTLTNPLDADLSVTLRLAQRAPDAVIDALAGQAGTATASDRLTGVAGARASAAFDLDPSTRWVSAFDTAVGTALSVPIDAGVPVSSFSVQQPTDDFSTITRVNVTLGGITTEVDVPAPDATGISTVTFPPQSGAEVGIEVTGITQATTIDRRYGTTVTLPVAISEITGLPTASTSTAVADCRSDLLTIDSAPVPLRVDSAALLAGEAVEATPCDGDQLRLSPGAHTVLSTDGLRTGIQVDDLRLLGRGTVVGPTAPVADLHVDDSSTTAADITVGACPKGCWLIYGQGANPGWQASAGGRDLGAPSQVSGGFSGWFLPPSDQPTQVHISFAPQRTLTVALVVSAAAVLTCVVLILRRRRRETPTESLEASESVDTCDTPLDLSPTLVVPWTRERGRSAWYGAAALVLMTALLVAPVWALPALVIAMAMMWWRGPRLVGAVGLLGIAAVGTLVVQRQVVYRYPISGGWPGSFESFHRAGMFVIFLLCISVFASDRDKTDEPPHE